MSGITLAVRLYNLATAQQQLEGRFGIKHQQAALQVAAMHNQHLMLNSNSVADTV